MIIPALDQVTIAALLEWVQMGGDIDGEAANDQSGTSVSLSDDGTIVAIGAYANDGAGGANSGHVRVYQYDATKTTAETDQLSSDFGPIGWRRLGADIDGDSTSDFSGYSVSLSSDGSIVAIGAHGDDGAGEKAGHVKVYEYSGGSWSQLGADIDGEAAYDESGISVSLSSDGSIVAIGAPGPSWNAGHVRVYQYDSAKTTTVIDQTSPDFGPSGWRRLGADIDGEAVNDSSGFRVSLNSSGNIVAIGGYLNDGTGTDAGHVRVYEYDATKTTAEADQTSPDFGPSGWRRLGADIDGEAADDWSGYSVSLNSSGNIVAIGAIKNYTAGHVRVYEYDATKTTAEADQTSSDFGPSGWRRLGADIDGEFGGDYSGHSVSLSSDGSIVAIGAVRNGPTNIWEESGWTGHVRVYEWSSGSSAWVQKGSDIDGEERWNYSGYSVSLSSSGNIVAIGAITNSDAGNSAGHVRVHQI